MILASNDLGFVISHETFIKSVYKITRTGEGDLRSYSYRQELFDIIVPFKKKKSKSKCGKYTPEVEMVKKIYLELLSVFKNVFSSGSRIFSTNNLAAKSLADDFYKNLTQHPRVSFKGGNNSDTACVSVIDNEEYLIPRQCMFFCYDIKEISLHLKDLVFDMILLDPPWWNKYIRRKRQRNPKEGYEMLYDSDLVSIPINSMLKEDGLVAVWCTSAESHISYLKTEIFPAWGLHYISQWFWIKVTHSADPVCEFSEPPGKQPYERLIFAAKKNVARTFPYPEDNKLIMSIPSAVHSHKPPLNELLRGHVKEHPICLELFARYLLPNWTSYGNEVLKLQHMSLYEEVEESGQGLCSAAM